MENINFICHPRELNKTLAGMFKDLGMYEERRFYLLAWKAEHKARLAKKQIKILGLT